MNRLMAILTAMLVTAFVMIGCSGGDGSPIAPTADQEPITELTAESNHTAQQGQTQTHLWGYWDVYIDAETGMVDAVPLRHATFPANLTKLPVKVYFENIVINDMTGEVDIDIGLEHCLKSMKKYTGFDVIGVFMGDGNGTYPGPEDFAIPGVNDQVLLNADGYTRWFNAIEFQGGGTDILKYMPGDYGTPGYDPSAELNGYKYFADGLGLNDDEFQFLIANSSDRGMFAEGSTNWRHYSMLFPDLPTTGKAPFQYAVIGHWEDNINYPDPPNNVPEDFPPEANADEALVCDIVDNSNAWYVDPDFGGSVKLDISPWDWSATCDAGTMGEYEILIYSDAWTGPYEVDMTCTGSTEFYEAFHVEIPVETLTSSDPLPVWIDVRYPELDYSNQYDVPNDADGPLAGYYLINVPVKLSWIEVLTPNGGEEWAWGSDEEITWDSINVNGTVFIEYSKDNFVSDINSIATDEPNDGSYMWDPIPCDVSDTVRVRVSSTDYPNVCDVSDDDFSIVDFGWARTWGGSGNDYSQGVATDGSGNFYVSGRFAGIVNFDPGDGIDSHTANGSFDVFLSKFDSSGDFVWARTWGGLFSDIGYGVAADGSGNVYVTGVFNGTVDFDPDDGVDPHTTNGGEDVFLSKFNSSGDFVWARTWGGSGNDYGDGVAVDGSGNGYVTGNFGYAVDFDPDDVDEDLHTTNGYQDVFLSKFDSSGDFVWAQTWGGLYNDYGHGVAVDSSGNAYTTGYFSDIVDFDPGGINSHNSNGDRDVFLSKFDSLGNFVWARTWGGLFGDVGKGVAEDGSGNFYVTGYFCGTVDFDPDPVDEDPHTGDSGQDVFLSKFDSSGNFGWARTWGGSFADWGRGVAADGSGNVYVTGFFAGTVDFDPDSGDSHASNGGSDVYLSKFDSSGNFGWARTWGGGSADQGSGVAADSSGNAYTTGSFFGTVDFAPTDPPCNNDPDWHTSNGGYDAFLTKHFPDGCW